MGIKERQERDREAVRRAILDAARELFVAVGFEQVSIRKIAERIEYSPAAIYGYFPSKDDIFFALAEEGFRLLGDPGAQAGQEALQRLPPLERIRTIFWRLYQFSREHPQYFALMFIDRSVPKISREYERFAFAHQMKEHIHAEFEACIASGALPRSIDPHAAMRTLAVGIIGVSVLCLSERLAPGEDPDRVAANVLDVTLAGLRSGIELQPVLATQCPLGVVKSEAEPTAVRVSSSSSRSL